MDTKTAQIYYLLCTSSSVPFILALVFLLWLFSTLAALTLLLPFEETLALIDD
jgi:hypothetical protein